MVCEKVRGVVFDSEYIKKDLCVAIPNHIIQSLNLMFLINSIFLYEQKVKTKI